MISRILPSAGSDDLVPGLLDFLRVSFDLEVVNLFPDGVYERGGKGAHRLGAPVNFFSPWSLEFFLRTSRRECDTITFLCVLQTGASGPGSAVFPFKNCIHVDLIKFIVLLLLDVIK